MSDDWSLSTEAWIADGRGHTIDKIKEDVETLRKKLVQDYINGKLTFEQINKRFGVIK